MQLLDTADAEEEAAVVTADDEDDDEDDAGRSDASDEELMLVVAVEEEEITDSLGGVIRTRTASGHGLPNNAWKRSSLGFCRLHSMNLRKR